MLSRILCAHIETSSLWVEFVNKNRCISVRLVSVEVKSIDNYNIIASYNQNISLIFYVKDWSHVRLRHPSCVYISAQRQYTAVQNFPCITSLVFLFQFFPVLSPSYTSGRVSEFPSPLVSLREVSLYMSWSIVLPSLPRFLV